MREHSGSWLGKAFAERAQPVESLRYSQFRDSRGGGVVLAPNIDGRQRCRRGTVHS
jgi:hypothetical protein